MRQECDLIDFGYCIFEIYLRPDSRVRVQAVRLARGFNLFVSYRRREESSVFGFLLGDACKSSAFTCPLMLLVCCPHLQVLFFAIGYSFFRCYSVILHP